MAIKYTVVTASQFDKDLHALSSDWSKYKGPAVRCGFEAEMASSLWWSDFADKLQLALGINRSSIVVSERYGASHGGDYRYWSVESDSSIQLDGEHPCSIEVVSPILGIDAMLGSLEKVCSLMSSKHEGKALAISNSSTGLHITFSLEDTNLTKVNIAKLYFLLGEDYWRLVFGRNDTSYAKSVKPVLLAMVDNLSRSAGMKSMRQFDLDKFSQEMRSVDIGRYGTINISNIVNQKDSQDKQRIEFRLPGGTGYEHKFSLLSRVARRFAYALYASTCDAYDDVFALKLYKFIDKYKEATHEEDHCVKAILNAHGFSLIDIPASVGRSTVQLFSFKYETGSITHIDVGNPVGGFSSEIESQIDALAEKHGGKSLVLGGREFSLKPEVLLTVDEVSSQKLAYNKYHLPSLLHLFGLGNTVQLSQFTVQALAENSNCVDMLISHIFTMAAGPNGAPYANLGFFLSQHGGDSDPYVIYNNDWFIEHSDCLDAFLAGFGVEPRDGLSKAYLLNLKALLSYGIVPTSITPSLVGTLAGEAFLGETLSAEDVLRELNKIGYLVDAAQAGHAFVQMLMSDTARVDAVFMRKDVLEDRLDYVYDTISKLGFASEVRSALFQLVKSHGGWRASDTFPSNAFILDLSNTELEDLGITNIPTINTHPDIHTINDLLMGLIAHKNTRDNVILFFNSPDVLDFIRAEDFVDDDDFCIKLAFGWLTNYNLVSNSLIGNEITHNAGISFWFTTALPEFDHASLSAISWADVDTIYTTVLSSSYAEELFNKIRGSAANNNLTNFIRSYLFYITSARSSSSGISYSIMYVPPSIYVPLLNETGVKLLTTFLENGFIFEPTFNDLALTVDAFVSFSSVAEVAPHCLLLDKIFSTFKSKLVDPDNEEDFLANRIESVRRAGYDVRDVAPITAKEIVPEVVPYVHKMTEPLQPVSGEPQSVDQIISYIASPSSYNKSKFYSAVEALPAEDIPELFEKIQSGISLVKSLGFGFLTTASINPLDSQGTMLIKPEILVEGLKYQEFAESLLLALILAARDAESEKVTIASHRVYGYTWDDFFYLTLSPETNVGSIETFDTPKYVYTLGFFSTFVNPSILLSERSLLFYKKLAASMPSQTSSRLLESFRSGLSRNSNSMNSKVLDPKMPYPLLHYIAKDLAATNFYLRSLLEYFCK